VPVRRQLDYRDHSRELDANRYVYAVVSRRARGLSIGVNLNPDKVCNFDCPYCQVDRSVPGGSPEIEVPALRAELEALLGRAHDGTLWTAPPFDTVAPALRRVADIAFSGDGEPTTPAAFPDAAAAAREVRERAGLDVPLRLITNATRFDRSSVRGALGSFDELWCKLDAGSSSYFALVAGTRFRFEKLLANLLAVARERPIVIQSLFLSYDGHPPESGELDAWAERLRDIRDGGGRIDHVQVYTVVRKPADPRVGPLPRAALEEIAARARAAGVRAEVY
jgi:wyosine [tRNA(Phe)-imidazoG37] synthetase (radical SAM superfamily)